MPEDAKAPKTRPMDRVHVLDFEPLHMGYPMASMKSVLLVDFEVQVHGLEEMSKKPKPVSIVIIAHGWANKAEQHWRMASGLLGEMNRLERESGRERVNDVLVVTLDQRNHGARRAVKDGRTFQNDGLRLAHMACTITGGKQDQELVMQFLPPYLWPDGERAVAHWLPCGISLGGHTTWRLLRENTRVTCGVPIVSLPSETLGAWLASRAETGLAHGTVTNPTKYPPSLAAYWDGPTPHDAYRGKKILCIYGGEDAVLPWKVGQDKWNWIKTMQEHEGEMDQWIQPGFGHVITVQMVSKTAEWFWRWAVSQ